MKNMRQGLYEHILTLPLSFFRNTPPGVVVNSIVTELSSAGEFVGNALALPLINLLTLLAFGVYLFTLNPVLAAISLSIYPVVLLLVPALQKRTNKANKERVDETRTLSNLMTETITGINEVHGHGSYSIEYRKFGAIVEKLRKIRIRWSLYKDGTKLTNNFFVNLSPFLIFLIGGYLAMKGRMELGSLVAFLSAQEKLYDPWKEMINFYQTYQDANTRYTRTMEYFEAMPEFELVPEGREPYKLDTGLDIQEVSFVTDDGIRLIHRINLKLVQGEHLALVGFSGSGKSTLAQCVGQLYKYTSGHVLLGDREVADMTKRDVVSNIGYVSQSPFIFNGTIEDNLLYACASLIPEDLDEEEARAMLPSLDEIIEVLQQVGVFADVLRFGLNAILQPQEHADLIERLIKIRKSFQKEFGPELSDFVEFFDENHYLRHSSVSDNIIFGTPSADRFRPEFLVHNNNFRLFLDESDLTRPLLTLGSELSRQTIDILGKMPGDNILFEQSPFTPDELENYRALNERLKRNKLHHLSEDDRDMLLELGLRFVPARHKMVGLPGMLENLILEGRSLFREEIAENDKDAVAFIRDDDYIYSQTILNNILFGKPKTTRPDAQEKINQSIIQLLIAEDLLEVIVQIGLQFQVGSKGDRLSGGQRQKLAIARTFLKNPGMLIMDESTSALDNKSQARIQNQLLTRWKGKATLIAVVHRLDITRTFDRIAVMKAGNVVETGTYDELMAKKGMYYELVSGKR